MHSKDRYYMLKAKHAALGLNAKGKPYNPKPRITNGQKEKGFENHFVHGVEVLDTASSRILFDKEDAALLAGKRWRTDNKGYTRHNTMHKRRSIITMMHRVIMPDKEGYIIDHINGIRSDNRRINLRYVTKQQNSINRKPSKTNTTGVVGVSFNKKYKRYVAQIKKDGAPRFIGSYKNLDDAIAARKEKELELFGEYAPSAGCAARQKVMETP